MSDARCSRDRRECSSSRAPPACRARRRATGGECRLAPRLAWAAGSEAVLEAVFVVARKMDVRSLQSLMRIGGWAALMCTYLGSSGAGRSLACALIHVVRRRGGLVEVHECAVVLRPCGPRADRLAWPPSPRLALCAVCADFCPLAKCGKTYAR